MSFYSDIFLPRIYDWFVDKPHWSKYRGEQLAGAEGNILEIGVGTGLNLPHYPKHVRKITTIDPSPGMNRVLRKRIEESEIEVDQILLGSENMPFDEDTFDCIVSTITLCSIRNVQQAMVEIHRVLKPEGRLFFLEHGVSPDPRIHKWQRRLNSIQKRLAHGCRLDLDVRGVLESQPFRNVDIESFYMENTPRTHGYMYRGVAVK